MVLKPVVLDFLKSSVKDAEQGWGQVLALANTEEDTLDIMAETHPEVQVQLENIAQYPSRC